MLRMLIAAVSIAGLPAQATTLFKPLSPTADLSPTQEAQISRLKSLPSTETLTVIKVDEKQLHSDKNIQIPVNPNRVFDLVSNKLKRPSSQHFAWSGATDKTLSGMEDLPEGDAVFSVHGKAVSGSIRTDEGVYSLQPLAGGVHALVKVREDALPPEHPVTGPSNIPAEPVPPESAPDPRADQPDDIVGDPVTVLVVYTRAAASFVEPVSFAGLVVEQTNRSYVASDITTLKLNLVGTHVSALEDSGSDEDDLAALASGKTDEAAKIHKLRDKKKADLVVLISNNPAACGMAQAIYAGADTAYATVYHGCASSNLSFAHEVGHLLGACHGPAQGTPCSPFAYGHGFQRKDAGMRTIMAYQCSAAPCRRMPEWARPPVWGNSDVSHDARVLTQSAKRAAAFR